MLTSLDDLFEEFSDLEPQDQSQYLLELGYDLPDFPDDARTEENRVHGCQSQVWLITESTGSGEDARITVRADSDSNIVCGLIAILQAAYSGRTAREILEFDIQEVFRRLHLQQHISPQRRNGLRGMVERILSLASSHLQVAQARLDHPVTAPAAAGTSAARQPTVTATVWERSESAAVGPARSAAAQQPLDAAELRQQFPVLCQELPSGRRPVYLDSGASAQKPRCVIDKEREVEEQYFANAYRGRYGFGARIDEELEAARSRIAQFINAQSPECVAFTPGTTSGINMVAFGWGRRHVQAGDEILITLMEHHANFVPWQQLARERGAQLKFMPLTDDGRIDLQRLDEVLTSRTRVVAVTGMSNVLGTVPPIQEISRRAHAVGACLVVDGAQSVPHMSTDVQAAGIDFLLFSGHKVYGPTGVGVLYGAPERLQETDPIVYGGHMIERVYADHSVWAQPPARFEAGTLPIVQAIALGTAIEWIQHAGLENIHRHEQQLLAQATHQLLQIPGLRIFGPSVEHKGAIISFRIDGLHPEDLAATLDVHGVCTRHGHHCTMPLHDHLGVSATTRASFAAYNTSDDIDVLVNAIESAQRLQRPVRK